MATTTRRVRPKDGGGCLVLLLVLMILAVLARFVGALTRSWLTVPSATTQWVMILGVLYIAGRGVWRWLVGRWLPVCPHTSASSRTRSIRPTGRAAA